MILSHLRANAVAYLALTLALSTGTAYAADKIADGSVTTPKLAKNAVTSPKIKKGAVKSADVKDGSLRTIDLAPGVIPALPPDYDISTGPDGALPPAVPDLADLRTHVFTSGGGETYLQFVFNRIGVTCSAGSAEVGLYLDGLPVPQTLMRAPALPTERPVLLSASTQLTPGSHTASVSIDCPTGVPTSATHTDSGWFVLTPRA
ncbi:hypothetical protein [Nocardioides dilutus]